MRRLIERIHKRVPVCLRQNIITANALSRIYGILAATDADFSEQMDRAIQMYKDTSCNTDALYRDIICEFTRSWVRPVEYAKFELFNKSVQERNTYIPDYEEIYIFKRTKGNNILPDSKFDRYSMFKKYFHRQILCISSQNIVSETEYKNFISGKAAIIVKPIKGTKGHGIIKINTEEIPNLSIFKSRISGSSLLEEVIEQGEELKQFHPNSINTIRFVTGIDHSGEFHYLFALMRIGQGGSIIDNVSSGGLVALLDLRSGEIISPACQGTKRFEYHPDTKIRFRNFMVPQWEELRSLVREIHLSQPRQRVFGFDMAWTINGWDLVEVNPAPSFTSYQELTGKGIRPFLQSIKMV